MEIVPSFGMTTISPTISFDSFNATASINGASTPITSLLRRSTSAAISARSFVCPRWYRAQTSLFR